MNCTQNSEAIDSSGYEKCNLFFPTTPTLVISDTSTGQNNCIIGASHLSSSNLNCTSNQGNTCSRCKNFTNDDSFAQKPSGISNDTSTPLFLPCNNTEMQEDKQMFMIPPRNCDSAYASSMESRSENVSPSVCNSDNCFADGFSSFEGASNYRDGMLSVDFNKKNVPSLFSSTSSIASDCSGNTPTHRTDLDMQHFDTLHPDENGDDLRKLSSSSTFSQRSLSLEGSEDDFSSLDERSSKPPPLLRRDSKIIAHKSWIKLRSIVKWSPFTQSYKKRYPWVQLAGHAGSFHPGKEGCILKKYVCREAECLEGFRSNLVLRDFVPIFHGIEEKDNERFIRMQDLLLPFESPSIMDCKMGIRTYLEDELVKAKVKPSLRGDMYLKMIEISPDEPTEEERQQKAITKPRYMQWREKVSSTSSLGFRIEGIKKSGKDPSKDFKLTKTTEQVIQAFKYFIDYNLAVLREASYSSWKNSNYGELKVRFAHHDFNVCVVSLMEEIAKEKYLERLKSMREALGESDFFSMHEVIGSSLLFVHDSTGMANVWMIDFGKTSRLPANQKLDHRTTWEEGNREDGYLFGMDNMINICETLYNRILAGAVTKETEQLCMCSNNTDHLLPSQDHSPPGAATATSTP